MLLPAHRGFGHQFRGYLRIGYVNDTDVVKQGLQQWETCMETEFLAVPVHGGYNSS
jgi:hypothetical protein